MRMFRALAVLAVVGMMGSCSYSLPTPLQTQVDDIVQQTEGIHQVVAQIKSAGLDPSTLSVMQRRYGEMVKTHDTWRGEVQRVINNEINHFENDDAYNNSVRKLSTASGEFATAADAALGGNVRTTVPDWPDEARDLIVRSYNERKHKQAAVIVYEKLRMKPWDEI